MITKKPFKKYIIEAIVSVKIELDREIEVDKFPPKRITELANDVGIGRNALQTGFKEIYGSNIKEYVLQVRMNKACRMLEDGRKTIKQIAYQCGYRSQSNFASAFKRVYEITPKEYQERCCEEYVDMALVEKVLIA